MTSYIFDTGALSLFYAHDERLKSIVDRIQGGGARGFLSSVTLSEFYYKTCQTLGRDVADLWSRQLTERMRVIDADPGMATAAGLEKCRNGRLSLADSYALALAKRMGGTLLTTDNELAKSKETEARFLDV